MSLYCSYTEQTTLLYIKAYPLIILFFCYLFHLIQKLSYSELEFRKFLLLSHICIVNGMLTHLDVQMNTLEKKNEQTYSFRIKWMS